MVEGRGHQEETLIPTIAAARSIKWRQSYGWSHLWSEEVAEHPKNHTPDQETGHKLARTAARGLVTAHTLKLL